MSRASWLNLFQAVLSGLQVVNAGAATVHLNSQGALIIAAILAAGNYFVHSEAMNTEPPAK